MKNKIIVVLCLFAIIYLSFVVYGGDENWFGKLSGIELGISTKVEIEKLFVSAKTRTVNKFARSEDVYYDTKDGTLRVTYSLGTCADDSDGYDLETGAVIGYSFSSLKPIKASKLNLNFESFEKRKESDTENWEYFDRDSGKLYILFKRKRLTFFVASFTDDQKKQFTCKTKS